LRPWKCAACGRMPPRVLRLEAAHISPLSECAVTTPDNLILLCKEYRDDPEQGCHTLYDQGYCSVVDMHECRKCWAEGQRPTTRHRMMQLRASFGYRPQQQGHLKIALGGLKKQQASKSADNEDWHSLQIQIAEVTRRRARKDVLKRASQEIIRVDPEILRNASLKSRYFYEKGYIDLLSGRLNDAFDDFYDGRELLTANLSNAENRWRWAAHTALLAQLSRLMHSTNPKTGWSWGKIRQELTRALSYSDTTARDVKKAIQAGSTSNLREEYRNARRWVQNCLIHLIKPDLAQRRLKSARRVWDKAYDNWQRIDISSGWDAGFRPTLLSLYGNLMLESAQNEKDVKNALAYLVRSLVLMIGLRRQQPEGIRDLLFWIGEALNRINDSADQRIRAVASNCIDFGSWFKPYVPRPLDV